jgi:hypothetical protein
VLRPRLCCVAEPKKRVVSERPLICAECGAESEAGTVGWRAYLGDEDEVLTFCPECAAREFDQDG